MTLYLVGHTFRFALEEGVLSHFGLKPDAVVLCDTPPRVGEAQVVSRLSACADGATATCTATIRFGGRTAHGRCRAVLDGDERERKRASSHALKIALARAAAAYSGTVSPWGSLSGMRPSKLAMKMIEQHGADGAMSLLTGRYMVRRDRAALAVGCAEQGLRVKRDMQPRDVALYVGIPFCPTRCRFCSFVSSSTQRDATLVEPYIGALCDEAVRRGALVRESGLRVTSLYIGGGTPTTLTAEQLERLMVTLADTFDLSALYEYTVEAGRPDTITADKLKVMRRHGATRISINPQSMNCEVLERAARPHTPDMVRSAFNMARAAGFDHINMDIIAGMEGDTPERFAATLEAVSALEPECVTVHTLARKRGSDITQDFADGEKTNLSDFVGDMLNETFSILPANDYHPYYIYRQKYTSAPGSASVGENTGWSKPGCQCYYNIVSMEELQTVIALGAGGITKLVAPDGSVSRLSGSKYPREYMLNRELHIEHDRQIAEFFRERIHYGTQS